MDVEPGAPEHRKEPRTKVGSGQNVRSGAFFSGARSHHVIAVRLPIGRSVFLGTNPPNHRPEEDQQMTDGNWTWT